MNLGIGLRSAPDTHPVKGARIDRLRRIAEKCSERGIMLNQSGLWRYPPIGQRTPETIHIARKTNRAMDVIFKRLRDVDFEIEWIKNHPGKDAIPNG